MAEPLLGLLARVRHRRRAARGDEARARRGLPRIDAFSPYPVEGMAEVLALEADHRIGWITIAGGAFGFLGMLAIQLFVNWDYPIEVGNRPLFAWPAFFVVDFELMILCAVLFAVVGMFVIIGLPKLYHPLFNTPRFGLASEDNFFLYIDARDPEVRRRQDADLPRQSRRAGRRAGAAMRSDAPHAALAARACHQNLTMSDQHKLAEWERSDVFRNGKVLQTPAPGSVSREQDTADVLAEKPPMTLALVERGPRAVQHLLLRMPRLRRRCRRHGRPARLPAAAELPRSAAGQCAGRAFRRRHHQRLRRRCTATPTACRPPTAGRSPPTSARFSERSRRSLRAAASRGLMR